jgi:drug/metabolite transporter (DMT)-like permease
VIYGLVAAIGWGLADFTGAVTGRRIGSLWVVLAAQSFSAAVVTAIAIAGGQDFTAVGALIWWIVLNSVFSATAYVTHYRALELGPLAVVSPVGATYALVGVLLAVLVLGERPSAGVIVGGFVTVLGVMLTSTDLRKIRAGTHTMPPGLPWAIASAIGFGVGGLTLGKLSQDLGWELGLWSSRVAQLVAFVALGIAWRERQLRGRFAARPAIVAALTVGGADLLGVLGFSIGAEAGSVTPVLIASAVFPLIAVALSVVFLHERPVPNQYVGVAMTVAGLVLVGLGSASA